MHRIIRISLPSASTWQLFIYDIDLIISFYYGVMKGNENCGFNENVSNEVNRALNHAKKHGEYLPSFTSFIFKYLFSFDASNLINILRKLLFAYRAILIRYFL